MAEEYPVLQELETKLKLLWVDTDDAMATQRAIIEVTPDHAYLELPRGRKGDKGDPGNAISFQGIVARTSDLPTGLGASDAAKAWVNTATKALHVWNGNQWFTVNNFAGVDADVQRFSQWFAQIASDSARAQSAAERAEFAAEETIQQVEGDFATRNYVDGKVGNPSKFIGYPSYANTILRTGEDGKIEVRTQSISGELDAVNKSYVDKATDSALASADAAEGSASKASTYSKFADNRASRAEDLSEDAIRRVQALEVLAGFTPGDVPDATIASTVETGGLARAAIGHAIADDAVEVGSPVWQALQSQRIVPSLSPLSELAQPFGTAVIQEPDGTIYQSWTRTGGGQRLQKSVDGGRTWEDLGANPGAMNAWAKLYTGTIIAVEQMSTTTPGGSKPRVWRTTDDGANWTEVPAGLNFGPLGSQGISEGTDGSVMIAEYGNIGEFSYRIRRSTDDGQTWSTVFSSSGLEPQGDPGHIHSLTYDHVAGKHVIFVDRPILSSWGGPHIYASSDNGATWQLVGESDTVDKPNFVAPMYFENYIAWGSDNQINGRISRISRDDFYAGRFENAETVAQLSQKAMYHTFPLRPDVWAVSMALEHIKSPLQDGEHGSMMHEVWLVSQDGALVTGGMESYYRAAGTSNLVGVRASFPAYRFDIVDHHGLVWANMPTTIPRAYTAVPATQGYEPPIKRFESIDSGYAYGSTLQFRPELGVGDSIQIAGRHTSSYAFLGNGTRAHIRVLASGDMQIRHNQKLLAWITENGFIPADGKLKFSGNNTFIQAAFGSPKGVVEANPGSIYLDWRGAQVSPVWVKRAGAGVDGWEKLGHPAGSTIARPTNPEVGESFFDTNLGKPIWRGSAGWVDANGQPV